MKDYVGPAALSQEQAAVVASNDRAILVLASAGSGKTEVVAQRVERLLSASAGDYRVLALSYTRRAAAELASRFALRLGQEGRRAEADTIHGFAHSLITQYGSWIGAPANPTILVDDSDRVDLLQSWLSGRGHDADSTATREDLHRLDLQRARGVRDSLTEEWVAALEEAGALDYEQMLATATDVLAVPGVLRLMRRLYRHVIVDESQNLTASQYALLTQLLGTPGDLAGPSAMFLGDDKQSIVGFAGASTEYMFRFRSDYGARVFTLSKNFRSARALAGLGERIARELGERPQGTGQEYAAPGSVEFVEFEDEQAEGQGVAMWVENLIRNGLPPECLSPREANDAKESDIAVLARSTAALRATATALESRGIRTVLAARAEDWLLSDVGRLAWALGSFDASAPIERRRLTRDFGFSSAETAEQVRAELREDQRLAGFAELVATPEPGTFVERVKRIEFEDEGWFQDSSEIEAAWNAFRDSQMASRRDWPQFKLFLAKFQSGGEDQLGVRLQTVHKAQGREFKAVAVVGLNDGQFPDFRARRDDAVKSELRAFYVAVTRPSRLLLLTRSRVTASRYGGWAREPSPFLRLVGPLGARG